MNCVDYGALRDSYASGLVTRRDLEKATARVLEHKFRLGVFDPPKRVPYTSIPSNVMGSARHLRKAVEAAQKGLPRTHSCIASAIDDPLLSLTISSQLERYFFGAGIVLLKNRDVGGGEKQLPLNPHKLKKVSLLPAWQLAAKTLCTWPTSHTSRSVQVANRATVLQQSFL